MVKLVSGLVTRCIIGLTLLHRRTVHDGGDDDGENEHEEAMCS